jgi:predicted nucleic acid-binding protein
VALIAVVDTSVIVPAFLTDEGATADAQELLRMAASGMCRLATSSHAILETTAAFHKAVRRDRLSSAAALRMASLLPSLPIERIPVTRVLRRATRIAFEQDMTVYDALFVATAIHLRLPLVTADRRQGQLATGLVPVLSPGEAFAAAQ